eukprot:scaffold98915_cov67-Phaeocystis_antarctica.AAC.2
MASGCRLLSRLRVIASSGSASRSRAESDSRPAVHASALDVEIPPRPRLGFSVGRANEHPAAGLPAVARLCSVQSQTRLPACQVPSRPQGCGWPPYCRLPTGVAAPGGPRPRSHAGRRPGLPRLHVAALREHCESHEGAVLVASSAVCHGAAPERKPAGRLTSRLRSQLEYHEQSGWRPILSETNRQRLQRAQRCKHARAACVRLPDPSSRFSRVPPKEPRSPRLHVPSDPSSVSPQKPGRAEASHASALRAVTATFSSAAGRERSAIGPSITGIGARARRRAHASRST